MARATLVASAKIVYLKEMTLVTRFHILEEYEDCGSSSKSPLPIPSDQEVSQKQDRFDHLLNPIHPYRRKDRDEGKVTEKLDYES
jgi:hypothetical protein